jgi:choline dehydrogenase
MIGPFIIDNAKSLLLDRELYNVKSIFSYLRSGTGPLGSGVTPAHGFLVSSYAQASKEDFDHPDLQIIMLNSGLASVVDVASEHAYNIPKEKMRKVYGSENFGKDSFFMLNTLVRPKSTGNIVLSGPDPNAYPLINPGYFTHPDDIKVLVEG